MTMADGGEDPLADLFAADLADPALSVVPSEPKLQAEAIAPASVADEDDAALAAVRAAWEHTLRCKVNLSVADWIHDCRTAGVDRRSAARAEHDNARRELLAFGDLLIAHKEIGRLAEWRTEVLADWLTRARAEFSLRMDAVAAAQEPGAAGAGAGTDSISLLRDLDQAEAELGGLLALLSPEKPKFKRPLFEREVAAIQRKKEHDLERQRSAHDAAIEAERRAEAARRHRIEDDKRRADWQLFWMLIAVAIIFAIACYFLLFGVGEVVTTMNSPDYKVSEAPTPLAGWSYLHQSEFAMPLHLIQAFEVQLAAPAVARWIVTALALSIDERDRLWVEELEEEPRQISRAKIRGRGAAIAGGRFASESKLDFRSCGFLAEILGVGFHSWLFRVCCVRDKPRGLRLRRSRFADFARSRRRVSAFRFQSLVRIPPGGSLTGIPRRVAPPVLTRQPAADARHPRPAAGSLLFQMSSPPRHFGCREM